MKDSTWSLRLKFETELRFLEWYQVGARRAYRKVLEGLREFEEENRRYEQTALRDKVARLQREIDHLRSTCQGKGGKGK